MPRLLLAAALLAALAGCGSEPERPYVVLVSIDGFRHDYAALHGAPNLQRIARQGVRAEALIPPYPSSTFPSHYSIATGMYPEHHGIVENSFFDPRRRGRFLYNDKQTGNDGSWYGGTPLWALAEQQGVRSATFFWPGTDTEIQGKRPSAWFPYDESAPNPRRVDQVLEWLQAPEAGRPHFITAYFSDVDKAGHRYGPEAPETRAAVAEVDAQIGRLLDGLSRINLPVYVLVVSDHGMLGVAETVSLGRAADFAGFEIAPRAGAQVMLYSENQDLIARTLERLNQRAGGRYRAYRREETPGYLHYNEGYRIGDIVVAATAPVILYIDPPPADEAGEHGYDPYRVEQMRGIFYAQGPGLKRGLETYPFESVNVYPLIAHLLRLELPPGVDGSLDVLRGILNE
jgi:predicted AlkP superfamily pyrophosphatase or phosphodiesterase